MSGPAIRVFTPSEVPESNETAYPEPLRQLNLKRWNRRLGKFAGLDNFGVNVTRIVPGGQSSCRHGHSKQDEFVYVIAGEVVLETDAGEKIMKPGMCAGFPAGSRDAHRFVNRTDRDVELLVIGDRSAGDEVHYPDVDMAGKLGPDGKFRFVHKDGTPY
jgi:uncharacterized cupin superfamily protein